VTEDDHLLHTLARAVEKGVQGHKVCCVRGTVYGWLPDDRSPPRQMGLQVESHLPQIRMRSMGVDLNRQFLLADGTIEKIWSSKDVVLTRDRPAEQAPRLAAAMDSLAFIAKVDHRQPPVTPARDKTSQASRALAEAYRVGPAGPRTQDAAHDAPGSVCGACWWQLCVPTRSQHGGQTEVGNDDKFALSAGSAPTHVRLNQFEHVEGATFCKHLFPHYTMPDGKIVHLHRAETMHELVRDP